LQVAEALDHSSQRDVIHRDIKPSNVLITPEGKAKLVDMGLARLHQVEHPDNDLTASGVTLGTFDYISPEQARDPRSADVRSDLYSLGCSFYFMLTGRPPFPEGTVLQKLLQHQGDDPPDPRNFRPDLPAEVTTILARLLAKNPTRRYQQPSELIAELSIVGERAGIPSTAFAVNYRPLSQPHRLAAWANHLPWAVPLAALILIVLSLDYVWSGSNEAAPSGTGDAAPSARQPAPPALGTPDRQQQPAGVLPATNSGATLAPASNGRPAVAPGSLNSTAPPDSAGLANSGESAGKTGSLASPDPHRPLDVDDAARTDLPREPLRRPDTLLDSFSKWVSGTLGPGERSLTRVKDWLDSSSAGDPDSPRLADTNATAAGDASVDSPSVVTGPVDAGSGGAKPTLPRQGLLIVSLDRQGPGIFSSLMAAVSAAKTGETIELDFDGPHEERPFTISNAAIKIRAAEGRRPVIVFHPADADPVSYPRNMVTVAGGTLTITGVQWELDVPRKISADAWTLIETRRAELVRIEHAVLTIRNASSGAGAFHPAVAFFDAKAPPGSESMTMKATSMPVSSIELANTLVRGEATILRSDELEAVRFDLTNALLATSETLLLAHGANATARAGAATRIDMRQVTALTLGGLIRTSDDEDSAHLLPVELRATDSLLITAPSFAVVDQRGIESAERFREMLDWSATHVLFAGSDQFWRATNVTSLQSTQLDFAGWDDFWGSNRETDCRHVPLAPLLKQAIRESMSALPRTILATGIRQLTAAEDLTGQLGCNIELLPVPVESPAPAAE
jgi:serine/threonine-protein kinase